MIELNLIEAASSPTIVTVAVPSAPTAAPKKTGKRNVLIAVAAVVVILAGFLGWVKFAGMPRMLEGVLPTPILEAFGIDDPSRSGPMLNARSAAQTTSAGGAIESRRAAEEEAAVREALANSPENAVKAIQPSMFGPASKNGYASLLPMEKIQFQKAMAAQVLAFINAVTPDGVNFSDLIFSAPNYYYVRGVSESPVTLRNYLERLKMGSSEFKTPELPENAPATSLTAYGVISDKPDAAKAPVAPFVKESEVAHEIEAFRGLDANSRMRFSGLKRPTVEDFGIYRRYTYKVTTSADFQSVLRFVEALAQSPVRIGIESIKMSAAGRKGISTSMVLHLYSAD